MTTIPSNPGNRLDDLIDAVATAHPDPLDRVTGAVGLAEELDEVADSLIGHFVDQARRAGASWAEIGRSMGMSKQGAQKRFVGRPQPERPLDSSQGFSRFNQQARAVVVTAQERARSAGNDAVGIGHVVLGLIADPDNPAARCLTAQGVSLQAAERVATATLAPAATNVPALIPFDAHAKDALQHSFDVAQRRGADSVGSEDVLVALLTVEQGAGVLAGVGVTLAASKAQLNAGTRVAD